MQRPPGARRRANPHSTEAAHTLHLEPWRVVRRDPHRTTTRLSLAPPFALQECRIRDSRCALARRLLARRHSAVAARSPSETPPVLLRRVRPPDGRRYCSRAPWRRLASARDLQRLPTTSR